ncbi:choline/carnitine O-acyltransferase [Desulfovibrio sp. OttesenSCG-928-A18]|nr:choline/carnitine O-acyltransferase [Desulfovibrio sp. OttesenSCG-928-A18]
MTLFDHDPFLPPLPVPELHDSCRALPGLVQPLVDPETLENTRAACEAFAAPGGDGERLQRALLERQAAMFGNASWLRPLWDDMYTRWRGSLPLDMNYFFRFDEQRWGSEKALPRLLRALTGVLLDLEAGRCEPERNKQGFLSMEQAKSALYTRIPTRGKDSLLHVRAIGRGGLATAAVVRNGRWFLLPLTSAYGTVLREGQLAAALDRIRAAAAPEQNNKDAAGAVPTSAVHLPSQPIGAMTCAGADEAAEIRAQLQESLQNRLSLAELEQSLFVLCLDPPHTDEAELCRSLLAGRARDRFFTKSLQIIATDSHGLGANFEHAGCDAAIWVYILGLVDAAIQRETEADREEEAGAAAGTGAREHGEKEPEQPLPRPLLWDVPERIGQRLARLEADFARRVEDLNLVCRQFPELSRQALKALKTSPDAFIQTAFQAAQYRIFAGLRSSYEAVAMRGFAEGRTECARGSGPEALAFAQALAQNLAQKRAGCAEMPASPELAECYRAAERAHLDRLARCQRGLGLERHMAGLKAMYELRGKELGMDREPAIFHDAGWKTLCENSLSTSGIGAPCIVFFGFGPVSEDGLGIGYAPGKNGTGLVVTSLGREKKVAELYTSALTTVCQSMLAMLAAAGEAPQTSVHPNTRRTP